jgi:Amt family ammonium transporter
LNTDVAASFAACAWLLMAVIFEKKPKFLGLLTGAVAGLATVTPTAGYVTTGSAVIIGTLAGVVCYFAIWVKGRAHWDDALDVWGVHGVGGCLGTILLGFFASKAVNATSADGLFYGGGGALLGKQLIAVIGFSVYAFFFTYGMLWLINLITPVRVSEAQETSGLDESLHGEQAYI